MSNPTKNEALRRAITVMENDSPNSEAIDICYAALKQPEAGIGRYAIAISKLSEMFRMPNIEYVADEHNASVRLLRRAACLTREEIK